MTDTALKIPAPRFSPRLRKILLWSAGLVAVYALLGFLAVPALVRSQGEKALTERLHRPVAIAQVRFNPFTLEARVNGFTVKEPDGSATAASFEELYLDLSSASLYRLAPVLREVRLVAPYLRLVRNEDRRYNFQDLIDEAAATPPAEGPPPEFSLNNISVSGGRIEFDDRPEDQKHEIAELRIGVPFISNLPHAVDITVQPELSAVVNGAPFRLDGETKPFAESRETTLNLNLDRLQVPRYLEYSPVPLEFHVTAGELSTRLTLSLTTAQEKIASLVVSGEASLGGLSVQSKQGTPLLKLGGLQVALGSLDLVKNRAELKSVRIDAPELYAVRRKDGSINLVRALPGAKAENARAPAEKGAPFAFSLGDIQLAGGVVHVADEGPASPFRQTLREISGSVQGLSNAPEARATGRIAFATEEGARFAWDGSAQLVPLRVDGRLALEAFRLAALRPYYEELLNLEVGEGKLDLQTEILLADVAGTLETRLMGLQASISALRLNYPGEKEPLWRAPLMELKDVDVDVPAQKVAVGLWSVRDAVGYVRRDADGTTRYAQLLKRSPEADAGGAQAGDTGWRVEAKKVALGIASFTFDDRAPTTPVVTRVSRASWEMTGFSNARGARAVNTLHASVNDKGRVELSGPLSTIPFGGELKVRVQDLALPPFQPYLDDRVNVTLTDGALSTSGVLAVDVADDGLRLAYKGDVGVASFATLDKPTSQDLLKWKSLQVRSIDFSLEPLKLAVDEIELSDFYSRLIITSDGRLNLQGLAQKPGEPAQQESAEKADSPATPPAGETSPQGPAPDIRIGRIALQGGRVNFSDLFIKPNYTADLSQVAGTVTPMTPEKAGEVSLKARLHQTAPVEIAGRLNPLARDLFLDIKANARDIELSPLTPYSVKYAGYGIEKGKLSVDVRYLLENRKLQAENDVRLDQLTFGEKVESPTATDLPVLLAVALLKDRNGVIEVNLPVTGSLDDPQFSLGGVIGRVIVNLIVKAITAPFALLGAIAGGGEELAYVEFSAGSAQPDEAAIAKLQALAKALAERPGLRLDVAGRVEPETDLQALREQWLERQVKAQKLKALARGEQAPASVDDVRVTPEEYPKYLAEAYKAADIPGKPRNAIGLTKALPAPEMRSALLAVAPTGDSELRQLAEARAQAAKEWLVSSGRIPAERVFLVAPRRGTEGIKDKGKPTRVDFAIK